VSKTVAFAVPSLTHSVAMEFFVSAMQTEWLLAHHGYKRSWMNHCGDQFIAKARNKLVKEFLTNHPDCENFFFLDDDIGWPAAKVLEFCERDEDVLVGVYPKKSDEPDWPVMLAGEDGDLVEKDGLIRVLRAPTGFMRIKRRVLETLAKFAPPFMDTNRAGETETTLGLFAAGVAPDGWFWTEDYVFSQNVTGCGFDIWCDPDIAFSHRGNKVWTGSIKDDLPIFRDRARKAHAEAHAPIPISKGRRKRSAA
jgi:hypothetical protein